MIIFDNFDHKTHDWHITFEYISNSFPEPILDSSNSFSFFSHTRKSPMRSGQQSNTSVSHLAVVSTRC